ncbi:hypothetical protein CFBP6109_03563 [Pseudomonas syringae pv. cerasicola]|nr:hypothetical protein CFBP6109_03563 [Pseudomonas syringae pv. cerasicola]SPF14276.1 hypothetical protein PSCFBP6110_01772 [Pseudomonas syringae pv. cerasicola]
MEYANFRPRPTFTRAGIYVFRRTRDSNARTHVVCDDRHIYLARADAV